MTPPGLLRCAGPAVRGGASLANGGFLGRPIATPFALAFLVLRSVAGGEYRVGQIPHPRRPERMVFTRVGRRGRIGALACL